MFFSGKSGRVMVDGLGYAFGKWKQAIKTPAPKVTNYESPGNNGPQQANVAGVDAATITLDGPWDVGNMPLVSGEVYQFDLMVSPSVGQTVAARVTSIEPSNDVEGTPMVTVEAESTGAFDAVIL